MSAIPGAGVGAGPPVIVGLEIDRREASWPPQVHAVRWVDLGMVDGREDRRRVLEELAALSEAPSMTTIACDLTTTPDRGLGAFIESVVAAAPGRVGIVLTGGHALRERSDAARVTQRVDDWHELAMRSGVVAEHVLEVDLEHLTDASRARLARFVGAGGRAASGESAVPARRVEEAFAIIVASARDWKGAPSPREQAALQTRIAKLYRHEARSLRARLRLKEFSADDIAGSMKDGARQLVAALPDRLRRSPKWLAAGAIGGAAGCVAIGTLVAPVALAALPAWTMGGAGLGALLQFARGGAGADAGDSNEAAVVDDTPTPADAIRAAALFALLLELQGRDESEISRVLDRTLPVDEDPAFMLDHATCEGWLDDLRHRYDLALSAGRGSDR